MMWKVLFAVALLLSVEAQDNRRRRIKKKIIVPSGGEEAAWDDSTSEAATQVAAATQPTAAQVSNSQEMNKSGRGFLDDYYSKFDVRADTLPQITESSRGRKELVLPKQRPGDASPLYRPSNMLLPSTPGKDIEAMASNQVSSYEAQMYAKQQEQLYAQQQQQEQQHYAQQQQQELQLQEMLLKKQQQQQLLLKQQTLQQHLQQQQQLQSESQQSFQTSELPPSYSLPVKNPSTNYLQSERRSDSLATKMDQLKEQEKHLLQLLSRESELSAAEKEQLMKQLELWEQKRAALELEALAAEEKTLFDGKSGERFEKSAPFIPGGFSSYGAPESIPSTYTATTVDEYSFDSYDEPKPLYKTDTDYVTKYFGLTGTTSRDIQLGLTFTVPFLSIPLTSINSIIGGNFGDIGNILNIANIDTGSIITFVVIAVASVFILPQAIYWLTGINLSSFNWGRSDDEAGGMVALANTVDKALQEFNIDSRGCVAKHICTSLYEVDEDNFLAQTISKSAYSNPVVKTFLGPVQAGMLENIEKQKLRSKEAVQEQCNSYFRGTCPWDPSGVTSILMKLMESQGTNLAEVALKAVAAATES